MRKTRVHQKCKAIFCLLQALKSPLFFSRTRPIIHRNSATRIFVCNYHRCQNRAIFQISLIARTQLKTLQCLKYELQQVSCDLPSTNPTCVIETAPHKCRSSGYRTIYKTRKPSVNHSTWLEIHPKNPKRSRN